MRTGGTDPTSRHPLSMRSVVLCWKSDGNRGWGESLGCMGLGGPCPDAPSCPDQRWGWSGTLRGHKILSPKGSKARSCQPATSPAKPWGEREENQQRFPWLFFSFLKLGTHQRGSPPAFQASTARKGEIKPCSRASPTGGRRWQGAPHPEHLGGPRDPGVPRGGFCGPAGSQPGGRRWVPTGGEQAPIHPRTEGPFRAPRRQPQPGQQVLAGERGIVEQTRAPCYGICARGQVEAGGERSSASPRSASVGFPPSHLPCPLPRGRLLPTVPALSQS